MKEFSLGKEEKLKSRKEVGILFANGKSVGVFPIRVSYRFLPVGEGERAGLQVGVSASKRNFKRAVDRNRIKRLLREAYRLQKKDLLAHLEKEGLKGFVFFLYVDKTLPPYATVFQTMGKCLRTLQKKAQQTHENPS
ncbi:ribonuclease P protein component [Paraflavisolibacter sp. H34]|uniref:ribonuclease P protein component n=1 Tax=Huijunlia imazamoxiresistens TaxID=3127457 RepID=UPI00301B538C